MQNDLVLAELDTARTALAKADTIQKTKNVLDVAVAAETYAKRQKLGEEAVMYATSIKVEALKQLGIMLKETPRNKGASGRFFTGNELEPVKTAMDGTPTLAEMGLDKKTSKLAQDIASLPDEQFERVRNGVASLSKAQKKAKEMRTFEQHAALVELAETVKPSDRWDIFQADIKTAKVNQTIDAVITDPPYPKEYLSLWSHLARFSKDHLKPGGVLLAMTPAPYLPEVMEMLGEYLTYQWIMACVLPGSHGSVIQSGVRNVMWKPILVYRNGGAPVNVGSDMFENDKRDKEFHEWGQGVGGYIWQIENFTKPNDLVCDPFLGGGTTAIAALQLKRRFVGFDCDAEKVAITKGRLNDVTV
jgi:hypothetical protein